MLIKKKKAYRPSSLPPNPFTVLHFSFQASSHFPPAPLSAHQSIYLTWWTVRRAKLIYFRVHGSLGNHLMSAPKPIWSKHYPSMAYYRTVCFAMVCTCALPIDPASKSIVPHLQKPAFAFMRINTYMYTHTSTFILQMGSTAQLSRKV